MTDSHWVAAYASVQGFGHIAENTPCQDHCLYKSLTEDWSLAVVSDGAGSAKFPERGSEVAVRLAGEQFQELFLEEGWADARSLPGEEDWKAKAKKRLEVVRDGLVAEARSLDMDANDLSCTLIVCLFSPHGALMAHIGDGRAAFRNKAGEWRALMTPLRGETANETVFVQTDMVWDDPDELMEFRVVKEEISAVVLMTDGCEKAAFEVNLFDAESGMYFDPNQPFARFLEPNRQGLLRLHAEGRTQEEINTLWTEYLTSGNDRFRMETDDKTMVFVVEVMSK